MIRRAFVAALLLLTIGLAQLPKPGTGASPPALATSAFEGYQILQHRLPAGSTQPWTLATDHQGRVWFVEQESNQVGMYDPRTDAFAEYAIPTPGALPQGIALDGAGDVWFVEVQASKLGELPQGSNKIVEFPIPRGPSKIVCGPIGVTPSADGRIWMTCEFSNQIDEFSPSTDTFLRFDLPVAYSAPLQIAFDGTGNFWFTAADSFMLGYATVSQLNNGTSDGIEEFAPINQTYVRTFRNPLLPNGEVTSSLSTPSQIALSPDGSTLWITEHSAGSFDRYVIGTKSLVKYYTSRPVSASYPESLPNGIAVDRSGIVWIAEHYGNRIARFDPVTEGLTEYQIPCCKGADAASLYLALGANGTVWFTEFNGDSIGELIPVPNATGPTLTLSPETVSVGQSSETTFDISALTPESFRQTTMDLEVAGVTPSGNPSNLTTSFDPTAMALVPGANVSSTLRLEVSSLAPGSYYLTVSGRILSDNVTEGVVLKLTVSGGQDGHGWLLYLAAGLSAVVVLLVVIGRSRRRF